MVAANQPDNLAVDKQEKKAVVVDAAIPSDSKIRRMEQETLMKYKGLKEELERM